MQSEINLTITIDHDGNIPDSATFASDIAAQARDTAGLPELPKVRTGPARDHAARLWFDGDVTVFLRSAFIPRRNYDPDDDSTKTPERGYDGGEA